MQFVLNDDDETIQGFITGIDKEITVDKAKALAACVPLPLLGGLLGEEPMIVVVTRERLTMQVGNKVGQFRWDMLTTIFKDSFNEDQSEAT